METPQNPNQALISDAFELNDKKPLLEIIDEYENAHSTLFPEDYLYGSSSIEKYNEWIKKVLMPHIRASGDEGKKLWQAVTVIDLQKDPELLVNAAAILSEWFFPEYKTGLAALSLLIIVRKIVNTGKNNDE